ncbi:MAG: BamA/TamA family outer membrane protein [Sulfuritalea sp.]|nr:BamA/TamA family outer membrane protein [Sulfuritalea sp.]
MRIDFRSAASKRLLSERDFVRTHLRLQQQWWPLGERDSLALRGEIGFTAAASRAGVPQDYLFRSGGAQTVRGHAYQSLGVREGDAVVGGRAFLWGSLEYHPPVRGPWARLSLCRGCGRTLVGATCGPVTAVGAGLRWQSPVGPLALDLARGSRSGRWYPHFALMVAF